MTDVTTFYLIRHAEKESDGGSDPALTEQGIRRAHKWAEVFKHIELDAVYSTDYKRTRDTASVIARSQQQEVILYPARDLNYAEFADRNLHKSVLLVGHSNTIPAIANGLVGKESYSELDESNYSMLFIVDITGTTRTARVMYIDPQSSD